MLSIIDIAQGEKLCIGCSGWIKIIYPGRRKTIRLNLLLRIAALAIAKIP